MQPLGHGNLTYMSEASLGMAPAAKWDIKLTFLCGTITDVETDIL